MKKALLVLVVLCVSMAVLSCGSTSGGGSAAPAAAAAPAAVGDLGAFRIRLDDNFQWGAGYETQVKNANLLPEGAQFQAGENYTLKITYTVSRDLEDDMYVRLVDTTEAAGWWLELSVNDETVRIPPSKEGEVVSATIPLKIVNTSTSSSTSANAVVFTSEGEGVAGRPGSGVKKPFNVEFTEFVLTKN